MAKTAVISDPPDARHPHRRRPFSTWVKKLANFKSSSDGERPRRHAKSKHGNKNNNPYPESGRIGVAPRQSAPSFATGQTGSNVSLEHPVGGNTERNGRSVAGTVSTEHDGSMMAPGSHGTSSVAGTSRTVGGGMDSRRGGDSTFSSPAPSVRSLATTLTTIQSVAPHGGQHSATSPTSNNNTQSVQFSQPFPTTSPASAIPAHLAPTGVPNTYGAATANGLLTDNASILTLASSSKRRRRRSMDTDASVRALAPSSVWGGSRESLPLSVLSSNIETGISNTTGLHGGTSRIGADRNSIYSSTGVPPALPGDRNSYYAKQADAASVRSSRPGHGRADSIGGPGANASLHSPLAGPLSSEKTEKVEKEDATSPTKEE